MPRVRMDTYVKLPEHALVTISTDDQIREEKQIQLYCCPKIVSSTLTICQLRFIWTLHVPSHKLVLFCCLQLFSLHCQHPLSFYTLCASFTSCHLLTLISLSLLSLSPVCPCRVSHGAVHPVVHHHARQAAHPEQPV